MVVIRRSRMVPNWLVRVAVALAATLAISGSGYLFLQTGMALAAWVSLPLLLLWICGVGFVLRDVAAGAGSCMLEAATFRAAMNAWFVQTAWLAGAACMTGSVAAAGDRQLDVRGKTAVVTGAASGIGAALAERLADRGARLILADRALEPLEQLATRLRVKSVLVDVSDPVDCDRLGDVAAEARLVCLNAGVTSSHAGPVWDAPPEEWQRVVGVNLGGVVNGLRTFVPRLLEAAVPAYVLITASLAGLATWPGGGPYAASKHAVITVAEQAGLALADSNVHITVLCPALVRSGMSDEGDDPLDVADTALTAIAAGRFLAVPSIWNDAIRQRAERLVAGLPPVVPAPEGS